jgi:hypothetical protein
MGRGILAAELRRFGETGKKIGETRSGSGGKVLI